MKPPSDPEAVLETWRLCLELIDTGRVSELARLTADLGVEVDVSQGTDYLREFFLNASGVYEGLHVRFGEQEFTIEALAELCDLDPEELRQAIDLEEVGAIEGWDDQPRVYARDLIPAFLPGVVTWVNRGIERRRGRPDLRLI